MHPNHASSARSVRVIVAICGLPAALLTWAVWGALVIGHFGTVAWPFDLFANFRVQYMGLFALCVIALTLARWIRSAIVALLGVAVTTASMAGYFPERVQPQMDSEDGFRLVSFNIWFRNEELSRVAQFLRESRADVIVLQEVDLSRLAELGNVLRSHPYYVTTPNVRRGLVILSRTPLAEIEHFEIPDRVTRVTRVEVQWRGERIAIIGGHLRWPVSPRKAGQRTWELGMIADRVQRETGPVLVVGDFNLTPWSPHFTRFIERSGLIDCALGQGLLPTWPSQFLPARIRIDHCFASAHWQVRKLDVGPTLGSDHLPTTVLLERIRSQ